jgi:hypothetical protein
VRTQLQDALAQGEKATLLAIDGSVIESIFSQLKKLPSDITHLVLAVGGNNLLSQMHTLSDPVQTVADALERVNQTVNTFRQTYHHMLETVLERRLPTILCTLYNPRFPEPGLQLVSTTAISVFDDVIIQEAALAGIPVIDLRLVCTEADDLANPIEPSSKGGAKIVRAVGKVLNEHDFSKRRSAIYF